jgi:copper chaperone CopZ
VERRTTDTITIRVEGMTCEHCRRAVADEVGAVPGVRSVTVDLGTKQVVVVGDDLDGARIQAAIADAGYEPTPAPAPEPAVVTQDAAAPRPGDGP